MTSVKDGTSWRPARLVPFNVVTTMQGRNGDVQVVLVSEYETIADLTNALIEDGVVYCARLILGRGEGAQDVRMVQYATPYTLGRGAVASIAPLHFHIDGAGVQRALHDFDWGYASEDEG